MENSTKYHPFNGKKSLAYLAVFILVSISALTGACQQDTDNVKSSINFTNTPSIFSSTSQPSSTPPHEIRSSFTPSDSQTLSDTLELIPENLHILFFTTIGPIEGASGNEVLAIWDSDSLSIDIVTWNGDRIPLLQMRSYVDTDAWKTFVSPIPISTKPSSRLAFYLEEDREGDYASEAVYIYELNDSAMNALRLGCKVPTPSYDLALGYRYLVFRCSDSPRTWIFSKIETPFESQKVTLSLSSKESVEMIPMLQDDNETRLFQSYFSRIEGTYNVCKVRITTTESICHSYNYWVGDISPDGLFYEVRNNDAQWPDMLGILPAECTNIRSSNCKPQWLAIDTPGEKSPLVSSWTPNSKYILFIYPAMKTGDTSVYWIYDVEENAIIDQWQQVGSYQFRLLSGGQPIWAPDGKHFIVERSKANEEPQEAGYLVSIEDWSHTLLWDGGVLLGVIQIP